MFGTVGAEGRVEQRRACGTHVIAAALFRHESPERSSIGMGWTTKKSSSMKRNEAAEQHALMNGRTDGRGTDGCGRRHSFPPIYLALSPSRSLSPFRPIHAWAVSQSVTRGVALITLTGMETCMELGLQFVVLDSNTNAFRCGTLCLRSGTVRSPPPRAPSPGRFCSLAARVKCSAECLHSSTSTFNERSPTSSPPPHFRMELATCRAELGA